MSVGVVVVDVLVIDVAVDALDIFAVVDNAVIGEH